MATNKIGFHTGPVANNTGIGDWMRRLDAAGIPFFLKTTDAYGVLYEASQYVGADHTLIYRLSTAGQNDGFDYDVPRYDLGAGQAAVLHWDKTKAKLPPEFDKERVWVEPINEVDKDRANWLGEFAFAIALLAHADGYKVTLFGWSSGEPGYDNPALAWETPGMIRYLQLCAEKPLQTAVALHEYNFNFEPWDAVYPWQLGRFQWLFDACDRNGIHRPTVHITEWGWGRWSIPTWDDAVPWLDKVNELYCRFPEIKGAALWNLDNYQNSGISDQTQRYIGPMTQYSMAREFAVPQQPAPLDPAYFSNTTPPPTGSFEDWVRQVARDYQVIDYNGISALEKAMVADGLVPFSNEVWDEFDGQQYAIRGARRLGVEPPEERSYYVKVGDWGNVRWVPYGESTPPPAPGNPPLVYRPTQSARVTRRFGEAPDAYPMWPGCGHEGTDFAAGPGDYFHATHNGVVVHASNRKWRSNELSAYGWHIVLKGLDEAGREFHTVYAHAAAPLLVSLGQRVSAGDRLALSGNTGNSTGYHCHFSCLVSWDVDGCHPPQLYGRYINPGWVAELPAPPEATPPPGDAFDLLDYLRPASEFGPVYEVRHSSGATETFQTQWAGGQKFRLVKNNQFEELAFDLDFIWRGLDTSPGPAPDYAERPGAMRFYKQFETGRTMARWCKRRMRLGEWFTGVGHRVEFFYKSDCAFSAANSGNATNNINLVEHYDRLTLYGIAIDDVIELTNGTESWFFANGIGLVAWESQWGESAVVQMFAPGERPNNVPESGCW